MLQTELLQDFLAGISKTLPPNPDASLVLKYARAATKDQSKRGILSIVDMIGDAKDEIAICEFRREERREQFLTTLQDIEDRFFEAIVSSNKLDLVRWLYNAKVEVDVIAASVTEALDVESYELDRPAFVAHTQELIADVSEWPINDYAKRNLSLSLNLVCQQAQAEAGANSDTELRRRIKLVVASFAIEFANLDKEFETRWETLKRWAHQGFKGASTPLGLTVDASKIAGLLPKP